MSGPGERGEGTGERERLTQRERIKQCVNYSKWLSLCWIC